MKHWKLQKLALLIGLVFNLMAHVACELQNQDEVTEASITGSISTSSTSQKLSGKSNSLSASDLTSYTIYCVSFEDSPRTSQSGISDSGEFRVVVPLDTSFGCFINDTDGNSVANFTVKDSESGSEESSMSISGDIDLGQLSLDLEAGELQIPKNLIGSVTPQVQSNFDVDSELHEQTYAMTCVSMGDSNRDQACSRMLEDGSSVFFRVLKAQEDGQDVEGLGVWASRSSFENCGSIDLEEQEADDMATDGVLFDLSRVQLGASFESDTSLCPLRDNSSSLERSNISNYFALGKLEDHGGYRKLHSQDRREVSSGCEKVDKAMIHFQPKESGVFLGHFLMKTYYVENQVGDCGTRQGERRDVLIRFTRN